eukprot:11959140-Alexandrium_andersonii.AAC.1
MVVGKNPLARAVLNSTLCHDHAVASSSFLRAQQQAQLACAASLVEAAQCQCSPRRLQASARGC